MSEDKFKQRIKQYKIFADIDINVRDSNQTIIPGVAYKISNKDIRFVSDLKIRHGKICVIDFKELKIDAHLLMGQITSSRSIDSGSEINKYILEFNNYLSHELVNNIAHVYKLS